MPIPVRCPSDERLGTAQVQYAYELEIPIIEQEEAAPKRSISLRPYQEEAIEKVRVALRANNRRVVLQLPTGSGKTEIAAAIIQSAVTKGRRTLFVTDMLTLLDQSSDRFDGVGIDHGIIQGYHQRYNPSLPLQVCSIQTLAKRKTPDADIVIIDEVHCLHKAHIDLMKKLPYACFIGLSATPWTEGLGKYFDELIVGATVSELIEQGYLVDTTVYAPVIPNLDGVKIVAGDWQKKALAGRVDTTVLNGQIVEHWLKLGQNRQTLAFAVNIAHSKHIAESFNQAGIPAAHIDGYMTSPAEKVKRHNIIEAFKSGELKLLSSVGVLSKGFDYPGASCAILARPTKSLMLHMQMIGRVLRPFKDKVDALILDHAGNTARHGFVTDEFPTELDDGREREEKKAQQERKEPLPVRCEKCSFMKPPRTFQCPKCGHIPERKHGVECTDDELVQVKKAVSKQDKQLLYSELLTLAKEYRYSPGWVALTYKEKFGNWPRSLNDIAASEVRAETRAMVQKKRQDYARKKYYGRIAYK